MKRMVIATLIFLSLSTFAEAMMIVMDFEKIVPTPGAKFNTISDPAIYIEDGYQITTFDPPPGTSDLFSVAPGQDPDNRPVPSVFLGIGSSDEFAILNSLSGSLFSLFSIDLIENLVTDTSCRFPGNLCTQTNFTGNRMDGSTVSQSFILDGFYGTETFNFNNDFRNLTSVEWDQNPEFHLFDNITLSNPIPELSTMLLFGTGLLGAYVRKRKRS